MFGPWSTDDNATIIKAYGVGTCLLIYTALYFLEIRPALDTYSPRIILIPTAAVEEATSVSTSPATRDVDGFCRVVEGPTEADVGRVGVDLTANFGVLQLADRVLTPLLRGAHRRV